MKGLHIARCYFEEWGLPYLSSNHRPLVDRIAAGLIGGSDSIGADDEISRDHHWGPGFTLWLTEADFAAAGAALADDLHAAIPDAFEGYNIVTGFGSKERSIQVRSMDEFFLDETGGHRTMPADLAQWNPTPRDESHLYFLKHGCVFHDPLGEFSQRRQAFCRWPRPALLQRLGNRAWQLWHYGEYNFARVAQRGDPLAVLLCKAEFTHYAMRFCFYLEEDFVPYWKWISYCFRRIEGIGDIAALLDRFHAATEIEEQQAHIEALCAALCARAVEKGFASPEEIGTGGPLALYNALEQKSAQLLDRSAG